jgi:hypothetical protein
MWNSMRSMKIPKHLIVLIREYREHEAKVQVEQGTTE